MCITAAVSAVSSLIASGAGAARFADWKDEDDAALDKANSTKNEDEESGTVSLTKNEDKEWHRVAISSFGEWLEHYAGVGSLKDDSAGPVHRREDSLMGG